MSRATRKMSRAIHAPCVHDVMTGIGRVSLLGEAGAEKPL
jgi:hypothetical protein